MNGKVSNAVVMTLMVLYIVSPLDLVPDVIPVAGWIDDLVAGVIGARQFVSMVSK